VGYGCEDVMRVVITTRQVGVGVVGGWFVEIGDKSALWSIPARQTETQRAAASDIGVRNQVVTDTHLASHA